MNTSFPEARYPCTVSSHGVFRVFSRQGDLFYEGNVSELNDPYLWWDENCFELCGYDEDNEAISHTVEYLDKFIDAHAQELKRTEQLPKPNPAEVHSGDEFFALVARLATASKTSSRLLPHTPPNFPERGDSHD